MILLMDNQNEQLNTNDVSLSFFSKLKIFLSANKIAITFIAILSIVSFGTTGYLLTANNKTPPQNRLPQQNIVQISSQISQPQQAILNASPTASLTASAHNAIIGHRGVNAMLVLLRLKGEEWDGMRHEV